MRPAIPFGGPYWIVTNRGGTLSQPYRLAKHLTGCGSVNRTHVAQAYEAEGEPTLFPPLT